MLRYEYPEELVPDGETPITYRKEVERGITERFPHGMAPEWEAQSRKNSSDRGETLRAVLPDRGIVRFARRRASAADA
jgi:error-prone DNA polymerase